MKSMCGLDCIVNRCLLQMCCARVRGAAAVALVLAHNVGFLLMYLAADYEIPHR